MDLFTGTPIQNNSVPLAERLRPATLNEVVGQQHLLAPGKVLRNLIEKDQIISLILWGPPGTGKTTIAQVIANSTNSHFVFFSAVLQGIKDVREIVKKAREDRHYHGKKTVLFVDEIHRFNKAQQDAFLPCVEKGDVTLIGATTENPSFEINAALLSRSRVFVLEPLGKEDLHILLRRALNQSDIFPGRHLQLDDECLDFLASFAQGDARQALNTLELLIQSSELDSFDLEEIESIFQNNAIRYDKTGEEHYNIISAFIKSLRGSDPDAALYWLARMLEAGEDPLFIARRLVIFASEDIGNADPRALQVAIATQQAVHFIGLPEGRIPLAQAVTYLATAPKSNAAYAGINAAITEVQNTGPLPVPLHLRNAPTRLMKDLDYGKDYQYAHNFSDGASPQKHLPKQLENSKFYQPSDRGYEKQIRERMAWLETIRQPSGLKE